MWLIASRFVFILSGYVIHMMSARYLDVAEYGILGFLLNFMVVIRLFFSSGMPQSVSRFTAERPAESPAILRHGLVLSGVGSAFIFAVLMIGAPLIAAQFGRTELAGHLRLAALIVIPMAVYQTLLGSLNGLRKFREQAVCIGFYSIVRLGAAVALLVIGFRTGGVVAAYVLGAVAALALAARYTTVTGGTTDIRPKSVAVYAVPLLVSSIGTTLLLNVDMFMVVALVPDAAAQGVYASATTIGKIPYYLFFSFAIMIFPVIAHLKAGVDGEAVAALRKNIVSMTAVILPSLVLLSVFAEECITILYGSRYTGGSDTLGVLVFGFGALVMYSILTAAINTVRPRVSIIISIAGFAGYISLAVPLVRQYGGMGSAMAMLVVGLLMLIASARALVLLFGSCMPTGALVRIGAAGVLLYAASTAVALIGFPAWTVFVSGPLLAAGYGVLLVIFRVYDSAAVKASVLGIVKKVSSKGGSSV